MCEGDSIPSVDNLEGFIIAQLKRAKVEYFGRNGARLYSNPKAIMESLKGKFFIQVSFGHLLKLDPVHAFAVIKAALKMGMVKVIKCEGDGLEVILP